MLMKTVFLKPRFKGMSMHALNFELITNPPENYKVITNQILQKKKINQLHRKYDNNIIKKIFHYTGGLPYIITQSTLPLKGYDKYDLIYASQHVINTKKPWVVDFEYFDALSAYSDITLTKKIIEKKLKTKSCKAILPHSEFGKSTIFKSINCKGLEDKIKVMRYSVTPKKNELKKNNDGICRLLFVGSNNLANINAIEQKGIFEIIDAFIELQKKYDKLELIIRSNITQKIIDKTKKVQNIKILNKPISQNELKKLYLSSDIFPHTGFEGTNRSMLEAMSYGLPVIIQSLFGNSELINNMQNGILIDPPNAHKFQNKRGVPNAYSDEYIKSIRNSRSMMTKKVQESLELLILNSTLRRKIGKAAKETIEQGEFSQKNKNKVLKEIFDEATS